MLCAITHAIFVFICKRSQVPEEEWQCEICQIHKLNGVSNCELESEFSTQYIRHYPVGMDRHGRKYWYLARRLFMLVTYILVFPGV